MNPDSPPPTLVAAPSAPTVLAVAAHPDDIESWCAGTLALMVRTGARVTYAPVTSGDKGVADATLSVQEATALREAEQREAARRLGVSDVRFLGYGDGFLEESPALRERLVRLLREVRPDVVFTHDPEHPDPPYLTHRDHRVVGRAVLDAAYPLARDPRSYPEHGALGFPPHAVRSVWLFGTTAPTVCVDIHDTLEAKIAARLAHASQTPDPEALRQSWRDRAAAIGAPCGADFGETFVALELD